MGLAELGLREALGALLRLWNENPSRGRNRNNDSGALGETGETADLTIYRIVQEIADQRVPPRQGDGRECEYRARRAASRGIGQP